jgi:hypothetical protein
MIAVNARLLVCVFSQEDTHSDDIRAIFQRRVYFFLKRYWKYSAFELALVALPRTYGCLNVLGGRTGYGNPANLADNCRYLIVRPGD